MQFTLGDSLPILERTPAVLRQMLIGIPDTWIHATEGPDTWSPYIVVGHLVHGDRTDWIPRARIILQQGENRRFQPFDRFAQFHESEGKSLTQLLDEFAQLREAGLHELRSWNLTDAELALEGEHPEFGPVTLRQLLSTWTAHDLGHILQISRVMARQYREAVGPWAKYLSVMNLSG